jgi:site-specific recombinase XerD
MPADSLVHAFALWLQAVESENRSPKTVKLYEGRLRQFAVYLQGQGHAVPFPLTALSAENVRRASTWIREQSAGHRGGESAARALVTTLKTVSAWLADESVLAGDQLARVRRPKVAQVARTPFSQAEVRSLAVAAAGSSTGTRDVAIIHVLLDTGMRVGCALAFGSLEQLATTLRQSPRFRCRPSSATVWGSDWVARGIACIIRNSPKWPELERLALGLNLG